MVPVGQAFIIFLQNFGGAFWLAIGQTIFNKALEDSLQEFAPDADAPAIIHAGASDVRDVVSGVDLDNVILAFNQAVSYEFYLCAALSSLTAFACLGIGWKKIVTKDEKKKQEEARASTVDVEKQEGVAAASEKSSSVVGGEKAETGEDMTSQPDTVSKEINA